MIKYNYGASRGASIFKVKVHGKSCHAGRPYEGINAGTIAAEIMLEGQRLVSAEMENGGEDLLVFGVISAGTASNIIPGEAVLEGAVRSYNNDHIAFLKTRFIEIAEHIAAAHRGTAEVIFHTEVPALQNDRTMVENFKEYLSEISSQCEPRDGNDPGTEDFAVIGTYVPSMLVNVGAGSKEQGYKWGGHDPHRVMDEEALKTGAACYANCAFRWTQES